MFRKRGSKTAPLSAEEGGGRAAPPVRRRRRPGGVDEVRAFLNSRHEGLNGRPIDIAIASDAGLLAVEAAIAAALRGRRRAKLQCEARPGNSQRKERAA